ncbi:MAG: zf-HC2 domain-containing protein [Candidatus Hydrogenedentes bacterium]|nr:zf-HC2 domain-containing protein [Candidatus Hydrogenedentota bacterium]
MTCDRFRFDIALWVENDLSGWRARRLQRHLRKCPHCQAYAESFRRHQATVKQVAAEPIDDTLAAGLVEAVMARTKSADAQKVQPVRRPRPVSAYRTAAVAAGLALALVAAWLLYPWTLQRPMDVPRPLTATTGNPVEKPGLTHPAVPPVNKPVMVKLLTDDPNVVFVMLSE